MTYYLFHARDIAAYFKWSGVPGFLEKSYLEFLFSRKDVLLARPVSGNYETLEKEVYREMYFLWSVGFINEFSDVSLVSYDGATTLFCEEKFLALESYMKLIAMHLILSNNLPYVRIYFIGLPMLLGIDAEFASFEKNLVIACNAMRLTVRDIFGREFDLARGIPNELLCVYLCQELKDSIFGIDGSGRRSRTEEKVKMRIIKEKSVLERTEREKEC
jgi:hypothetical protein